MWFPDIKLIYLAILKGHRKVSLRLEPTVYKLIIKTVDDSKTELTVGGPLYTTQTKSD